jgi:SAM-dependent methyltransferase
MNFDSRAHLSEWMDEPCTYEDFRACLLDLEQVNHLTFAYRPTLHWLESVIAEQTYPIHIVDVGSGGGDMLRKIEKTARHRGIPVRLTGIDLNPYAARAAAERTPTHSQIRWITGDAFSYQPDVPIDLVISSLFTHHLSDQEIVRFLAWMEHVAKLGWYINDLHRECVPYYGFQLLARVMRWHRFVQHDGPVSIRRAFRNDDWVRHFASAGLEDNAAEILRFRPARLCVSRVKV